EDEAHDAIARGEVQFVVTIPENFSRDLLRGDRPVILIEADATDPAATSTALGSLRSLLDTALRNDLKGPLSHLNATDPPIEMRIHAKYNPEVVTQYNIVPGLMGVVLTMTMVMITALAITRERERGTMENLLAMPARPFEVLIGKIVPYILVGYVQVGLILVAAHFLFHVPMIGDLVLLLVARPALSAPTWRWGSRSRPLRRTSSRRCRCRSSSFCRRSSCPGSCFRSAGCRDGHRSSAKLFRSPTSCGSSAEFCSREMASKRSCRSCGRSGCSP